MSWWRQHWRLGLVLIILGIGAVVVVVLLLTRKSREAEKLKAELEMLKISSKVDGLEADKKARTKELKANTVEAEKLDKAIAEAKRATVAVTAEVDGMSDEEVAAEFERLGY